MKKSIMLILSLIIMIISLTACSGGNSTAGSKENEVANQDNNGVIEYPFDEPIIALDNDFVCIQITGKMFVDPENRGDWIMAGGAIGYSYVIENKLPDASLQVFLTNASIDGFMLDGQAGPYSSIKSFDAGKKGKGYFYIPLDGRSLGVDIKTIDDLHDFDANVELQFDEDGNGYMREYHKETIAAQPFETTLP